MLEVVHNSGKHSGEYLTEAQIKGQLHKHKYIVTGYFARDDAHQLEVVMVAKVLYKGGSEKDAKKIWFEDAYDTAFCNILFTEAGAFNPCTRLWFDVSDVEYSDFYTESINYPIGIYDAPDSALGEPVFTKKLIASGEDIWYVVRVYDIDLATRSFIGQIVYKGVSKQEAVDAWKRSSEGCATGAPAKHFYIFNPALSGV